jgi:acetyltransferase-like isoleucine patch superfamily enzyme
MWNKSIGFLKTLRRTPKYLYRFYLAKTNPVEYAKRLGVCLGEGTRIFSSDVRIFGSEPFLVRLGRNCFVTDGVRFLTHDGAVLTLREKYPNADIIAPIIAGDCVFFGVNSIILPGVTIGNNVIIAAGAVVTKDIPSNSVVAGCPAKIIKTFDQYEQSLRNKSLDCGNLTFNEKRQFLLDKFPPRQ